MSSPSPHDNVAHTHRATAHVLAIALITSGLISGCSGQPGVDGPSTTRPNSTKTSTPTTHNGEVKGASADLHAFVCEANPDGVWSAKGTMTNPQDKPQRYTLAVSVASSRTSTVVGRQSKTLTLAADKSAEVQIPNVATSKAKSLRCTAHVTSETPN